MSIADRVSLLHKLLVGVQADMMATLGTRVALLLLLLLPAQVLSLSLLVFVCRAVYTAESWLFCLWLGMLLWQRTL